MTERAILAGGCFWGMQDLIRKLPGVESTRVGYTGGDVPNATYRNHGTHAEGIEIMFDPDKITYRRLLEFFFQIHDPTTPNRQGNDRGASYRSAIYYVDDDQKAVAEDTIADVNASGIWPGKVVTEVEGKLTPGEVRQIRWELAYNRMPVFGLPTVLYGLAAVACMVALLTGLRGASASAWILLLLAFAPHTIGIIMRMVIMDRPPVTNLYATFLFVPWVMVGAALVLEYFFRNKLGLLAAGLSGMLLLLLSRRFETEADSLGVVVAVLNSNFWLLTHVICITAGYAAVALAGILGHFYLIRSIRLGPNVRIQPELYSALFGVLALGLVLSFLGTMLGGVWGADSWGRFWGWDPKENGALLIVLWTAVLLHGIPARWLTPNLVAAGAVLGNIVVLWAWMGTNLLGVGLHSYGFMAGRFYMMIALMGIEVLFVVLTLIWLWGQRRSSAAVPAST